MHMKDLRIFISYTHEDEPVATALSNLLQQAFGPALAEVFLDKQSISFGGEIKGSINLALDKADILIAVITGGEPASALSWPGYEIGRFLTGWDLGQHHGRARGRVIGQVAVLCNSNASLGSESGKRPIRLGITEALLSGPENDLDGFKKEVGASNDLLRYLREIEQLVIAEDDYRAFFHDRQATLVDLTAEFKTGAFRALKRRVRHMLKPSKQMLIRYRSKNAQLSYGDLPDDARISSCGGASEIFGKHEGDPSLFRKVEDGATSTPRFEATWRQFKASLEGHPFGAYWCEVLTQAVVGARTEGVESDQNLVLISHKNQRYRVVTTTITTFYNDDAEVSVYLIEALQRPDYGDPRTSNLLRQLNMVCRFRFAFLEGKSPFYWKNFDAAARELKAVPVSKAGALLMELDYLKSEARNADVEKPGSWEGFMTPAQLSKMMEIWFEVDLNLRQACNALLRRKDDAPDAVLTGAIGEQLKRLHEGVRPYNDLLGSAISNELRKIFDGGQSGEAMVGPKPAE
jgi:hypothetical protein